MPIAPVSKLVRIAPTVSAYSSVFTAEDAVGYPKSLPEARKIGLGRRSLTGFLTSGNKVRGLGAFESALERDYFVLLEFDRLVLAWHPQPLRIDVPATPDRRATHYTPDVAVEYTDVPGGKNLHRVELCEIKYREELKTKWDKLKPALKAGHRYARSQGWKFQIYTEVEIRTARLKNAKFFLPYAERGTDAADIYRLTEALRKKGPCTPAQLMTAAQVEDEHRGRMLGVIWHMVAKHHVEFDMSKEITMNNTVITLNEQSSS